MKIIKLTQGFETLVDDDIYESIGHLKWRISRRKDTCYVITSFGTCRKDYKNIYLHHVVMGTPLNKLTIDHLDGNGLNNQRSNLEIKTKRKNQQNRKEHRKGKLLGAIWHKGNKKWLAKIYINGKDEFLGYFDTPEVASNAYKQAIEKYYLMGGI